MRGRRGSGWSWRGDAVCMKGTAWAWTTSRSLIKSGEAAYDAFYNANKAKLKSVAVAMEVVAFIFDALLKALHSESACTGSDEWKQEMTEFEHRYHAQLAYAKKDLLYCLNLQFKDQREWDNIIQHLTQAISRRPPKDIGTYEGTPEKGKSTAAQLVSAIERR